MVSVGIYNNFPAPSWIKLDGISVVKGEEVHIVSDFKTNLKYIYWSSDAPNQLTASNVMLNRTATRFLIVVNNKGECVLVPNEEISVSFDGNSVGAINEHIWGLYEKDEEYGNRFVSVEQNIEGITQTVGQTKEELGKVSEQVSKVEQKADSIDLSVKNLDREYNNNKEMQELRENVNKSIINVNSAIGLFKAKITETFKDNEISEDEGIEIQAQIDILEDRKSKVIDQVDRVIALMEAEGNPSEVTKLTSQKQAFINAIDNVITLVNTAISDKVIVPSEITVVTDAFGKASLAVNTLKNTLDEIIFLGTGGTISEELARIGIKSDEIVLSVNKVEQKVDNDTAFIKNELVGQIKDVSDALNGLEDTMNNSFLDGVLSDSEKIALKKNLDILATEKLDIDKQFESIYNNTDLVGEPKTALQTAYNTYVQKYTELVEAINTVVDKEGNIDINDQSNVNSCIVAHREALGDFSTKASSAIDAIAGNKASAVDKKYSEILLTPDGIVSKVEKVTESVTEQGKEISKVSSEINQMAGEIDMKVSAGDIASSINQTPQGVKINASKINLNGYVTISDLSSENSTVIDGSNIRTGTIAVDQLKSNNANPIIRLFDGCSLDATKQYEQGIGDAIRLKYDSNNYLFVSRNSVSIYQNGEGKFVFTSDGNSASIGTWGGKLTMYGDGISYKGNDLAYKYHYHSPSDVGLSGSVSFGDVTCGNGYDKRSYMGGYISTTGSVRADGGFIGNFSTSSRSYTGKIETNVTSCVTPNVEYIGEGVVENGVCTVDLPPAVCGMGVKYNIQITPIGNNPTVYVAEKNKTSFVVKGDDCDFDYIVKVSLPKVPKRLR